MSEADVPVVPKRHRRHMRPAELDAGDDLAQPPELAPKVQGVLLGQGKGGWVLIDVAIPEDLIPRFATRVREPEMAQVVFGQAELRLGQIIETSQQPMTDALRGGRITPERAMAQLHDAIAELGAAFWGAFDENDRRNVSASLQLFAETGRLEPVATARKPNGDDRARLQSLAAAIGAWPT